MSFETRQALPAPYFKGRGQGWGCNHLKHNQLTFHLCSISSKGQECINELS